MEEFLNAYGGELSNTMEAKVKALAVDQSDIEININVMQLTDFESVIAVQHTKDYTIDSKLIIRKNEKSDINMNINVFQVNTLYSSISISAKNQMFVKVDAKHPPIINYKSITNKDSYISSKSKTYNYGFKKNLLVGNLNDEIFKSYVSFRISNIPKNVELISSNVILSSSYNTSIDKEIDVYIVHENWDKYGITWVNQPLEYQYYKTIVVPKNSKTVSIDVLDLTRSNLKDNNTTLNFMLDSTTGNNSGYVRFDSSNSEYQPYVNIKYFDPVIYSNGKSQIDSNIIVKNTKFNGLQSRISISRNFMYSNLYVIAPDTKLSKITITKNKLMSHLVVKKNVDNDPSRRNSIDSNIEIRQETVYDFESTLMISRPIIKSKIIITHYDQLPSTINIKQHKNISGKIIVATNTNIASTIKISNSVNLNGNINIFNHKNILSKLLVKKYNDLQSSIATVPCTTIRSKIVIGKLSDLESNITIIGCKNIPSNIIVTNTESINSKLIITNFNSIGSTINCKNHSNVYSKLIPVISSDISVDINIMGCKNIHSNIIVTNVNDLSSTINVSNYENINSNIIVRQTDINELYSKFDIRRWDIYDKYSSINIMGCKNIHSGIIVTKYKTVDSKIDVTHYKNIQSNILITKFNNIISKVVIGVYNDIECSIKILNSSNTDSNIVIRRNEVNDLETSMSVRKFGYKDVFSTLDTMSNSNIESYIIVTNYKSLVSNISITQYNNLQSNIIITSCVDIPSKLEVMNISNINSKIFITQFSNKPSNIVIKRTETVDVISSMSVKQYAQMDIYSTLKVYIYEGYIYIM